VAVSANDVWAFGDTDAFGPEQITNLVMHWDGTKWSIVPSPDPNPRHLQIVDDVIDGGTVDPQGNLWLVGVADGFGSMVLTATKP
jgi:sugar lactone lactonase YvrE